MNLVFSWWNTGLSPMKAKGRATEDQKRLAFEVVSKLLGDFGVDCLVLGEVTEEDLNGILSWESKDIFEIYSERQVQFGIAFLYRRGRFEVLNYNQIFSARGGRKLKIASELEFSISSQDLPLHLFACHWPSRLWCHENSADRHLLGAHLRGTLERIEGFEEGLANVIVMGDFNDEPFAPSLAEQLLASRDRYLVRKKPILLYNPFWRRIGEAFPHVPGEKPVSLAGTCFHKSGHETKWRTFDQIIFSSAFLNGSGWQLNEKLTRIVSFYQLEINIHMEKSVNIFDHYPVVASIQWRG